MAEKKKENNQYKNLGYNQISLLEKSTKYVFQLGDDFFLYFCLVIREILHNKYLSFVEAGDYFNLLLNNIVYFLIQNNQGNTGENVEKNHCSYHGNRRVCRSESQSK